jgi:hypothetical protein
MLTENDGQIRMYKEENFGIKFMWNLFHRRECGLVFADWHMILNIIKFSLHVTVIVRKSYDYSMSTFACLNCLMDYNKICYGGLLLQHKNIIWIDMAN